MIRQYWHFLCLTMVVAACTTAPSDLSHPMASPVAYARAEIRKSSLPAPTPTLPPIEGEITDEVLLNLMFPGSLVDFANGKALLRTENDISLDVARVLLNRAIRVNGAEKRFVIVERSRGECHACHAEISGILLTRTGTSWTVESLSPQLLTRGTFGHVFGADFIEIGSEYYGALIESGASYHGYYGSGIDVIALIGSDFEHVFNGDKSRGADRSVNRRECVAWRQGCLWGYDSTVSFMPGVNAEFYDLHIDQSGTNPGGYEFSTSQTYVMLNGRYVFQSR